MEISLTRHYDDAIAAIYEASTSSPCDWNLALSKIARALNADGAAFEFADDPAATDFPTHEYPALLAAPRRNSSDRSAPKRDDIRHVGRSSGISDNRPGRDADDHEPGEAYAISAGLCDKPDAVWTMSCAVACRGGPLHSISVWRTKASGAFAPPEKALFRLIGRHAEQAIRTAARLEAATNREASLLCALDSCEDAVFLLRANGDLALANRLGQELWPCYFDRIDDRVIPHDPSARAPFDAIRDASKRSDRQQDQAPSTPFLATGTDGSRLILRSAQIGPDCTTPIILLGVVVSRKRAMNATNIRSVFGLSPNEARLAALIAGGDPVQDAAEKLGIAEGTARIVLKKVFKKLGINRQTELILELSGLANRHSDLQLLASALPRTGR